MTSITRAWLASGTMTLEDIKGIVIWVGQRQMLMFSVNKWASRGVAPGKGTLMDMLMVVTTMECTSLVQELKKISETAHSNQRHVQAFIVMLELTAIHMGEISSYAFSALKSPPLIFF